MGKDFVLDSCGKFIRVFEYFCSYDELYREIKNLYYDEYRMINISDVDGVISVSPIGIEFYCDRYWICILDTSDFY